jgi:Domain of unknown function (DUF3291)
MRHRVRHTGTKLEIHQRNQLAQFNIARVRYPLDDPRMAEFVENVDRVHRLAEQIPGFVWQTLHRRFYARREEWFEPINTTLVFWWVPVGHHPDMSEGVARLDHLLVHDPSDYAFGWKEIADAKLWKTARGDALSEHAA